MVYMCKNKDLSKKYDLSSIETILCGAAPLSKDIEKEFMEHYIKDGLSQGKKSRTLESRTDCAEDPYFGRLLFLCDCGCYRD